MRLLRILRIAALAAAMTTSAALATAQPPQPPGPPGPGGPRFDFGKPGAIQKVAENLYVVPGGGGNTTVFVASKGVVLVDTKTPGNGQAILDQIKTVTDKPVIYIINTHVHFDHTGSNPFFPEAVEIVAHENLAAALLKDPNFRAPEAKRGLVDRPYKDRLTLLDGDDAVELYNFGPSHTSGDTLVVFRKARAVATGDVFASKGQPIIDIMNNGSGVNYGDVVGKAASTITNVDVVIPGHAPVLTWQDFVDFGEFNRVFLAYAREARKAGKTPAQAMEEFKAALPAKFKGYTLGPGMMTGPGGNFEPIFNELLRAEGPPVADPRPPNGAGQSPAFPGQTDAPEQKLNVAYTVIPVVDGLQNPWGMAFLPDGRILVTERAGTLRVIAKDGTLSEPLAGVPPVAFGARAQGGLLDVAIDPGFATNRAIYWSYSEPRDGGVNNTAVTRATLAGTLTAPALENVEVIFHQTPSLSSPLHFGSRLVFGRDGTLFVTLGDRSIPEGRMQAQRLDGQLGKVVRINTDGSVPKDNPFVGKADVRPEIWSYGHRNIQAATLHPTTGELWEVEHGTRGGDELNIARKAKDYGWPTIAYGIEYQGGPITGDVTKQDGMEQPRYYWDPVIAPSGMTFYTADLFPAWKGSLFIGGLSRQDLVRLTLDGEKVVGEERLLTDLEPRARIRDVTQGPDGAIYVLTDGPKGRMLKLMPKS